MDCHILQWSILLDGTCVCHGVGLLPEHPSVSPRHHDWWGILQNVYKQGHLKIMIQLNILLTWQRHTWLVWIVSIPDHYPWVLELLRNHDDGFCLLSQLHHLHQNVYGSLDTWKEGRSTLFDLQSFQEDLPWWHCDTWSQERSFPRILDSKYTNYFKNNM